MKRDLKSTHDVAQSINPGAKLTGTINGTGVDTQGYESALCVVDVGAWTDGSHTLKLQDSPDNATWTDTPAADQQGVFTPITSAGQQNTPQRVGYVGSRRFVRAVSTVTGTTTGAIYGAMFVRGDARFNPLP